MKTVSFSRNSLLPATFLAKLWLWVGGLWDGPSRSTTAITGGGSPTTNQRFKDSGFKTRMPFLTFRRCRSWNSTAGDMGAMARMWDHLGMAQRHSTTDGQTSRLSFRSGFEKPMSVCRRLGRLPVREGQPWKRGGA